MPGSRIVARPGIPAASNSSAMAGIGSQGVARLAVDLQPEPEAVPAVAGWPGFLAGSSYPAGAVPTSVAVGDFNGDGKLDLAVANATNENGEIGTVSILLGNGDGTYRAPVKYSAGPNPYSVAVVDFNGDGNLDIAVANNSAAGIHTRMPSGVTVLLGNGDGTFKQSSFTTNLSFGFAVATGDFNGDGKPDFVLTTYYGDCGGGTVTVFLGKGGGSFTEGAQYTVGYAPISIAVGDFNGDGNLDIVTSVAPSALIGSCTGAAGNNVSVLLGNGDGTFQAPVNYAVGSNPTSVAIGDFNGDGTLDIVTSNWSSDNVSLLLGNGDGTFQPAVNVAAGTTPYFVTAADFNGDGKLDLAVSNEDCGCVSLLLGNGNGTFRPAIGYYSAGDVPFSLAVGDFNGDGKTDVVTANYGSSPTVLPFPSDDVAGTVSVLLGNGNGTFHAAISYSTGNEDRGTLALPTAGPFSVALADLNGDGKLDLAVANSGNGTASVLLGNGDGTFQTEVSYPVGKSPFSVAVADFNGDGKPDLAVANNGDGTTSVLVGNGDGTFQTAVNYTVGASPISVAAGDFNGDGKLDLVVADYGVAGDTTDNISVLLGNGDGTFQTAVSYTVGANPYSVAAADLNRDGKLDLAVANCGNGSVSVLLGNGDGTFQTAVDYTVGTYPYSVTVGDFNGDGKPDLAIANLGALAETTGSVSVLLGNGDGTFQAAVSYSAAPNPNSVAVGDFNGDGKLDLAVADEDGTVSVLLGNGDGTFQAAVNFAAGGDPNFLAVGDLNGDGTPDLAVADYDGGVSILLNLGVTTTTTLSSSLDPSTDGQPVTFKATVKATGGSRPNGGTVTFYDGMAAIGEGTTASGVATFTTTSLAVGTHLMTAAYAGYSKYTASTSPQIKQVVGKAATTTALISSLNPSTYGQSVTFTATVSSSGPTPTGTVTFKSGSVALGTATLSSGVAGFTSVKLAAGTDPIAATYGGDSSSQSSTSAPLNQSVAQAATATTVASSKNPSNPGQSVTFTATVTSAYATPTGTVTFSQGATTLGTATLAGGKAKLAVTSLTAGSDTVTATYGGTGNFSGSSGSVVQTVN